jgi:hypothetical protein
MCVSVASSSWSSWLLLYTDLALSATVLSSVRLKVSADTSVLLPGWFEVPLKIIIIFLYGFCTEVLLAIILFIELHAKINIQFRCIQNYEESRSFSRVNVTLGAIWAYTRRYSRCTVAKLTHNFKQNFHKYHILQTEAWRILLYCSFYSHPLQKCKIHYPEITPAVYTCMNSCNRIYNSCLVQYSQVRISLNLMVLTNGTPISERSNIHMKQ